MWHHLPWETISGLLAEAGGRYRAHGRSPLTPWVSPRDTICPTPIMTRHAFFLRWKKTQFFWQFSVLVNQARIQHICLYLLLPLALQSIWDGRQTFKKPGFVWNLSKMKLLFAIWVPICHDDPSEGGRDVSVPQSWTRPPANRPILGKWRRYRGRSKFSDLRRRFMRREKWSGL